MVTPNSLTIRLVQVQIIELLIQTDLSFNKIRKQIQTDSVSRFSEFTVKIRFKEHIVPESDIATQLVKQEIISASSRFK